MWSKELVRLFETLWEIKKEYQFISKEKFVELWKIYLRWDYRSRWIWFQDFAEQYLETYSEYEIDKYYC